MQLNSNTLLFFFHLELIKSVKLVLLFPLFCRCICRCGTISGCTPWWLQADTPTSHFTLCLLFLFFCSCLNVAAPGWWLLLCLCNRISVAHTFRARPLVRLFTRPGVACIHVGSLRTSCFLCIISSLLLILTFCTIKILIVSSFLIVYLLLVLDPYCFIWIDEVILSVSVVCPVLRVTPSWTGAVGLGSSSPGYLVAVLHESTWLVCSDPFIFCVLPPVAVVTATLPVLVLVRGSDIILSFECLILIKYC